MAVRIVNDKSHDSMVYIKVVLEHMAAVVKVGVHEIQRGRGGR